MGYYAQGDYYAGDPGFMSGLGKVFTAIKPYVAPALAKVAAKITGRGAPIAAAAGGIVKATGRAVLQHPVLTAAAAAGTIGIATMGAKVLHPSMAGRRGFHVSRRTGKTVRNRHMNVYNPRALHRAVRRATGFAKMAMRTIHLIHPKKKVRFGGFRKRRAKR